MVLQQKISFVLSQAHPFLAELHDDYFLIGSTALCLSGVDIAHTADIDLLTTPHDADHLKIVLADRLKRNYHPEGGHQFRSHFGRFNFDLMDIEVMGGLEVRKNDSWQHVAIHNYIQFVVNGIPIKIPTLEEQKRILTLFGRPKDLEKINLIESFKSSHLTY